jgi:hypothetical protein
MAEKPPAFPKPASHAQARVQMVLGGVLALLGVAGGLLGTWTTAAAFLSLGAALFGLGIYVRRSGVWVQLVNSAFDAITRGRLPEAEALLDHAEASTRIGYLRRVVDLQRAVIALRRGELASAMQRADAALARPLGLLTRGQERVHLTAAHALRALLRASSGDERGAREDIAAARRSPDATPDTLARAELAEAVVLERSGDRGALRDHLSRERSLLLGYTAPRERAVARAYQRMLEARRSSVYREGAPREPQRAAGDEPTVADWMATVAPAAAPFARRARAPDAAAEAPPPAEAIDPEARRAAAARVTGKGLRTIGKLALLWVLLIMMFVAIWQFLGPGTPPAPIVAERMDAGLDDEWLIGLTIAASVLVGVALSAAIRIHAHRQARRLFAAVAAIARGDEGRGEAELRALAKSRYPVVAGQALLQLAAIAERRADFAEALAACDRGLEVIMRNPAARVAASSILLPELVAERAVVLAATGRDGEAAAEMAMLAETYPAHPYLACAELRVGLMRRVRRGDLEGAARLVGRDVDDIPLTLRDEALADVVRAAVDPESAGPGEIERLQHELRLDARLRGWLEAVAPSALAAFAAATRGAEAPTVAEQEREVEAEREAEAIQEGEARGTLALSR